mgnify:CR=1 FL=1
MIVPSLFEENGSGKGAGTKGEHMTAARMRDELEELRKELTTMTEESDEARSQREQRQEAAIARWQGIGDSVQKLARQITPLVLVGAVVLGILVGRLLAKK